MKTFRPNNDPPLDNARTTAPTYHAVELLPAGHSHMYNYITIGYSTTAISEQEKTWHCSNALTCY